MWIYDGANGAILDANSAATALYGYTRLQFQKLTVDQIRRPGAAGAASNREEHVLKDGRVIRVEIASQPLRSKGRAVILVSAMDVASQARAEHQLDERTKRLRCLYALLRLAERHDLSLHEIYQEAAELLPESWQYPQIACARVVVGDREYRSRKFREAGEAQAASFIADQATIGRVEVRYLKKMPDEDEGPFLREERELLDAVAEHLEDMARARKSAAALQAAERRFRALVENAPDAITLLSGDGTVVYDSPAAPRLLGYDVGELIGHSAFELVHPDDLKTVTSLFHTVLQDASGPVRGLFRFRHKDGFWMRIEASATNLLQEPSVEAVVINYRDVTDREQSHAALRASEQKFRNLFNNAEIGIFRTRLDGSEILDANDKFLRIFGRTRDEVIGSPSVMHWANPADREEMVRRLRKEGHVSALECDMLTKHGDVRHCVTSLHLYPEEGILEGTILDISDRKQAEEALRESEQRYRGLVERSPDAIAVHQNGRFVYVNPAGLELLGARQAADLVGKPILEVVHPDYRPQVKQRVGRTATGAPAPVLEEKFLKLDGTPIDVEVAASQIMYGGQPATQVVVRDITERNRTRAENRALLEILQGASTTESLEGFLELAQLALDRVLDAKNMFVVFRDDQSGLFKEVFSVDKYDPPMPPSRLDKSITSYVFRTGRPLRLAGSEFDELFAGGDVELVGRRAASWLGAPLRTGAGVIGVIAVQNYEKSDCYTERDQEFLASVGAHVALAVARKRAADATAASEAELRALFAAMTDAVIVLDKDGRYLKIAPTDPTGSVYGPAAEMLGKTTHEVLPREQADYILEKIREALGHNQLVRGEYSLSINGHETHFSVNISPLSSDTVLLVAHDITNRKAAEQAIRARTEEVTRLYELTRLLAAANGLDEALDLAARHAVESTHVTVARFALQEDGELIMRSAYPVRIVGHDLGLGDRYPIDLLPHAQRALTEHQVVLLREGDPDVGEAERRALLLDFTSQACLVPLWVGGGGEQGGKTVGILILSEARSEDREPLSSEKIHVAQSIGAQSATTIRRLLLTEQTESRLRHVVALRQIDEAISTSFDLRTVLNVVLGEAATQLGVDAAGIVLLEPSVPVLKYMAARGFRQPRRESEHFNMGESYAGLVMMDRKPVSIADLAADPQFPVLGKTWKNEGFVTYYALPLVVKGRVRGVMETFHRAPLRPTADWLDFAGSLARQAAIAIENSELFDSLQRSNAELTVAYDATIEGWSHALDLRDKETEGHTKRVTDLTVRLARHFNFKAEDLIHLRWGALLHDIGKMAIPDAILLKPGTLTDEEWAIMRRHPTSAREMLMPIRYLRQALEIPYCHHERWDGAGYPRGLEGTAIPLQARIFAVVDVWDALTSDRPYRKAWSEEQALQHLREQSGKHFDPEVVEAFLQLTRPEALGASGH